MDILTLPCKQALVCGREINILTLPRYLVTECLYQTEVMSSKNTMCEFCNKMNQDLVLVMEYQKLGV